MMAETETREQILIAAFRLFMHGNYRDVTMNQLVQETGLSKGAFYHYFAGKQELFEATVDWLMQTLEGSLQLEPRPDRTFREYFYDSMVQQDQRMVEMVRRTGCKDLWVNYYKFIFNAVEYYPGYLERVQVVTDREFENWRDAIRQAQERSEIRADISASLIARHISVMLDGIGIQALFRGRPDLLNDWAEEMFEQFYGLIRT